MLHFEKNKGTFHGIPAMPSKSQRQLKKPSPGNSRRANASTKKNNAGAYESPVSGVGIVHDPDWSNPPPRGAVIHECGFLEANKHWNFTRVFSPFWRLYFNLENGHRVVFGNGVVELKRNRIVLIPPHRQFHCRSTRPVPSLWVHFSISRKLSEKAGDALVFTPGPAELALAGDLIEAISESKLREPTDRNFRLAMALVLAVLSRRGIAWSPDFPAHLLKAVRHLEENLANSLSIGSLARAAGIGEPRLRADFKKILGTTPGKYLSEIRVREAAAMLFHTDKSLDEIAEATGLGTRFYLSRVFKKTTGESPASYRRKHRR
jgi:AraC-like DNA-binding protein